MRCAGGERQLQEPGLIAFGFGQPRGPINRIVTMPLANAGYSEIRAMLPSPLVVVAVGIESKSLET
jgi:hypothetical protein